LAVVYYLSGKGENAMKKGVRILVLDDNVDVALGLSEILELHDYVVTVVHDGKSAVSAFDKHDIDLGLFDVRMPGMNGVEAFIEIRRGHPDATVLLMSGYADEEIIETALKNGALGLLSKPFAPEELLSKLESFHAAPETAR
jgi:CheY-like chemotaxis protein